MSIVKKILYIIFKILLLILTLIIASVVLFSFWTYARERDDPKDVAPKNGAFVDAGDVQLFYQIAGKPSDRPLILIHGMAAWSETWRKTIDALAEDGWYVVAIDMPPFGFSQRPENNSYWRTSGADRILAVIKNLKLSKPVIIAHSYGSRSAIDAVLKQQDTFHGLVVVDPALNGIYEAAPTNPSKNLESLLTISPIRYALVSLTITNPLLSKKLLQTFMNKDEAATNEVVATYSKPSTLKYSTRDFGYWLQGFMNGTDQGLSSKRANFSKITIPTTIIWGREDTTTPLSQGELLQGYIPESTLLVMDGVGHMPHIENTPAFNNLLIQALHQL